MVRAGVITLALCGCTYTPPGGLPADGPVDSPVDMPPDEPTDVPPAGFWTAVLGADAVINNLTKTTGIDGWGDSGAVSVATVASGDCYAEFSTSENDTGKALGLSNGDNNQSFVDIDFDIVLGKNRTIAVYEGSIMMGNFGTYVAGDVFRIAVTGTAVTYLKNGAVFFTSAKSPTYPLLVDAALFSSGASITNAVLVDL